MELRLGNGNYQSQWVFNDGGAGIEQILRHQEAALACVGLTHEGQRY